MQQTETTFLVPDIGGTLREAERTEYTERRIDPAVTRYDSTRLVRDINGRWQPAETRTGEARANGAAGSTEEETVQRRDTNGNVVIDERTYTRHSTVDGQDRVVTERYVPSGDQTPRSDSRLVLNERVQKTTRATAGGRQTIEEVEGRSEVEPNAPMRVIRRTETTVRQTGDGRTVTERQVFERDINGTMRLARTETEEGAAGR